MFCSEYIIQMVFLQKGNLPVFQEIIELVSGFYVPIVIKFLLFCTYGGTVDCSDSSSSDL